MSNDIGTRLRQLAAAADVPTFLHLVSSDACASVIRKEPNSDFRKLQRQGYSALVLAALSKGLQLYNAAAAQQRQRSSGSAVPQDLQLIDWLKSLAVAAINNVVACWLHWGEGSQEAKNMEQELLDSGVLPLMQQTWRQLAADMEQQQQDLQHHGDSTQQPDSTAQRSTAQAVLASTALAQSATLAGLLLQLWARCLTDNLGGHEQRVQGQPCKLNVAISSTAFLAAVATGIAAIWRSEGVLQRWRTASRDAAAAAPSTVGALGAMLRTAPAAAAQGVYRFARLQAGMQASEHAAGMMASAVTDSLHAAKKLTVRAFQRIERRTADPLQLPGSGAAHNLQWVMLVYTAQLVGELHQRQGCVSAVQLHTTDTTSSSQQGPPGSSSAGSSSAGSSSSSIGKGSAKKGSSKKASRVQQASSSSTKEERVLAKQQQGSAVPPYHLQVLETAGVLPHSLKEYYPFLDDQSIQLIESSILPTTMLVLQSLLRELSTHHQSTDSPQTDAAAAPGLGTSSNTSTSHSSATDGSSSAASGTAAAAAVLALLAPSSLMWGELLALFAGAGAAAVHLPEVDWAVLQAWQTSLQIMRQQATAKPVGELSELLQAVELAGTQLAPECFLEQQLGQMLQHARAGVYLRMIVCQNSWYRSCVQPIVPSLLHARAVGALDSARYMTSAAFYFERLGEMLAIRTSAVQQAHLLEDSTLAQGLRPALAFFSNPAASIPALEAAVRHNWAASTAPDEDITGLELASDIILSLTQTMSASGSDSLLLEERSTLLQHATDSSKSPALLSLLLSCMKQLQHSCQRNPQGALKIADSACMAGQLATRLLEELLHSGAGVPAVLSGSGSAGASAASSKPIPSGTAAPSSSHATAGQGVTSMRCTAEAPSTWLVLLGRVLYTAGAALQATHPTDASTALSVGVNPIPTSATSLLTTLQQFAAFACTSIESDTAAGGCRNVKVTLPCDDSVGAILQAQQALSVLLQAAAQHAQQLEAAAGISSSVAGVDSMGPTAEGQQHSSNTSIMRIWRQILGSEMGRQLPQALMDAGSVLCAALPSRFCCNVPSCCCLDKPSELQLAAGKGTKCSSCGVARYCSVAHQRLHWKQHKPACRAISAAAPAPAAAAAMASK